MQTKSKSQWVLAVLAPAALASALAAESMPDARPSDEAMGRPCFACHAHGEPSVIPDIRGKPEGKFVAKMREFRDLQTDSVMHRIAQGYREGDIQALARYFGKMGRERP